MFGSKQLLIAYCVGLFGLIVTMSALSSKHDPLELVVFVVGLSIVWGSALFGPLVFLHEKGILRAGSEPGQQGPREQHT